MTHQEFADQMRRLIGAYGDRAYPTERVQLFWEKFKHREIKVFEEAVSVAIASCAQPPLFDKLRECLRVAEDKFPGLSSDPYDEVRKELAAIQRGRCCHLCDGHGIILATRKDRPGNYLESLICMCRAGDLAKRLPFNRGFPQWLHHYDFYYVRDNEPNAREKLAQFEYLHSLPPEKRLAALVDHVKRNASQDQS